MSAGTWQALPIVGVLGAGRDAPPGLDGMGRLGIAAESERHPGGLDRVTFPCDIVPASATTLMSASPVHVSRFGDTLAVLTGDGVLAGSG